MEHHSIGGVVTNQHGEVVVVDQNRTSWLLPKGHTESGETELETARREIYEEAGITDLKLIKDLGSYQRHRIPDNGLGEDKSELKTIHMFLFHTEQKALKPLDRRNKEARWIPKDKVADLLTHPKDKEFFLSIIDQI